MADRTRPTKKISDEVLAGQDAAEVFRSGTLIDDLKKAVAERTLDAEMEARLEREGERDDGNHRNGHNRKRVLTDSGTMDLEMTVPLAITAFDAVKIEKLIPPERVVGGRLPVRARGLCGTAHAASRSVFELPTSRVLSNRIGD